MPVPKPKQYRWVCPECETAIHAPSRMRSNDVRRYCLDCSDATGFLVERACPVLDRKREASRQRSQKKAATKARRKRRKTAAREARAKAADRGYKQQNQERAAWRRARTEYREPTEFDRRIIADPDYYRGIAVKVIASRQGTYVPRWAMAIDNDLAKAGRLDADQSDLYESLIRSLVRWVYSDETVRNALNALVGGKASERELVAFVLENYPFPIPTAIRERYL